MRLLPWLVGAGMLAGAAPIEAQPRRPAPAKIVKAPPPPPLVGLTRLGEYRPAAGLVRDTIAVAGDKFWTLVDDGAVVTATAIAIADGTVAAQVALTELTDPVQVIPVDDMLLVVHGASAPRAATLVDLTGKVLRRWKPADAFAIRTDGGKPVVISHTITPTGGRPTATGKPAAQTVHRVELSDLATGKPLKRRGTQLTLDATGRDRKLDFRPAYFLDDMTVAVGVKGGVWRKGQDQQPPDTWARYDLVTGAWRGDAAIANPMELARRQPILAAHTGERDFVRMSDDLGDLERWADGEVTPLALDQLEIYDPTAVTYARRGDTMWVGLTVDPTNPAAVKRKKADPRYLDLFEVVGSRATRKARLLRERTTTTWGWAGDVLWVLERAIGTPEGSGVALALYRL